MKKSLVISLGIILVLFAAACGSDPVATATNTSNAGPAPVADTSNIAQTAPMPATADKATPQKHVHAHTPAANKPHTDVHTPAPTGSPFANTIDYICDMKVMADYTDTCHYKGKVYAFCSEYCKDTFKENPEKYLQ